MKINVKTFLELSNKELYEILKLRSEIFVVEQNCVYLDIDGKDEASIHIFLSENDDIYGYLRLFRKDKDTVTIGRVVTKKHLNGYGSKVLKEGIKQAKLKFNPKRIYIEAQEYAIGFYEKEGFKVISDRFLEDGIYHVKMILDL